VETGVWLTTNTSFIRSSNHQANIEETSSQLVEPASSCKQGITKRRFASVRRPMSLMAGK